MRLSTGSVVVAACLALLSARSTAAANCTPAKMVRIVYANSAPGIEPSSFAAQPKTLHRSGAKYGRIAERPDVARGIQGLMVVQEPDVWMVNLLAKAGQHIVDPGPTFFFRAPLITGASPFFSGMEFGCEASYMSSVGAAAPRQTTYEGRPALSHEAANGNERIALLVDASTKHPLAVRFTTGTAEVVTVRYLEYRDDLPLELGLFARPDGIAFPERK